MLPFDDPRFADFIRKLTGSKRPLQLTALADAMPVVVVAGQAPEDAFLRGDLLFMCRADVAAGAGVYGKVWMEMSGGEHMAVLERVDVVGIAHVSLLPALSIGSAGSTIFVRDSRIANQQGAFCRASIQSAQNAVADSSTRSVYVNNGMNCLPPTILAPRGAGGCRLLIETTAQNAPLTVNFFWRETRVPPQNL